MCDIKLKTGQKSVIVVPVDTFFSYKTLSIDSAIPKRYTQAISRARKNGHKILVVTQKPLSAHHTFFDLNHTGFFRPIFGQADLSDKSPNVVHFSPKKCENDRFRQLNTLNVLYQYLAD